MSQITIQLDDQLTQQLTHLATAVNLSIERFIAQVLAQKASDTWHSSTQGLVGAWSEDNQVIENDLSTGYDVARENL